MSTLDDKVAIITGASSGIGEATALELAKRRVKVILTARRTERLESLSRQIVTDGGQAIVVPCDIADREQVRAMIEKSQAAFGRIDILINNAGIMPNAPLAKCRMDDWDDMIDVNVKGVLYGIGFVLPIMLEQKTGHIINVSSVAGRKVFPSGVVYCATKHAVHAISEGLRYELAEQSTEDGNTIRVTTIAPGVVDTELPDSIRDDASRVGFKGYVESLRDPLNSEDIASAILYVLETPPHVGINEVLVRPTAQIR